jgi:hypothetical protein
VREGQHQVECAIQLRFTPKVGPVVYSEMTPVTIPGKIDATEGGFLPDRSAKPAAPAQQNAAAEPRKLNPDPHSLNVHTIRPNAAGRIEQASHVVEAPQAEAPGLPAHTPAPRATNPTVHADASEPFASQRDQRIAELERYVRQLEAQQARVQQPAPIESQPLDASQSDLDVEPRASRRLRLSPATSPHHLRSEHLSDGQTAD